MVDFASHGWKDGNREAGPLTAANLAIIVAVELDNARRARIDADLARREMEELAEAVRRDYLAFVQFTVGVKKSRTREFAPAANSIPGRTQQLR